MLSLPEGWDYIIGRLSCIKSIDAICTAMWGLKKAGYTARRQGRDEKGEIIATQYVHLQAAVRIRLYNIGESNANNQRDTKGGLTKNRKIQYSFSKSLNPMTRMRKGRILLLAGAR